ncbi:MAG: serine/threonine-protein phosphatase [Spirochaetaceae bacterium]|nr:serine/threonine-protein phosphatase [Spirochaetaceae bacterium]
MFKSERRLSLFAVNFAVCFLFLFLCLFFISEESLLFSGICVSVIFVVLLIMGKTAYGWACKKLEYKALYTQETQLLSKFVERLRGCYSMDDFFEAVGQILEIQGDCSVLYIDRNKKYVIYNSPDRLTCSPNTMSLLDLNFGELRTDGVYFMDENLGLTSQYRSSRGFFLVKGDLHLYIFCKYTHLFDKLIYDTLLDEFTHFRERESIISSLSEIAQLSKEWTLLADIQQSFLPQTMPNIPMLDLAAYFRPLVNVSGDYYTVLPFDDHKTLVMLGDVSGKGLAAALVMGLVMNTVKIIEDKEDLAGVIRAVDRAIKNMHLQDKYTVLFIGIVDTEKMTIRYVNASMSDPIIVTKAPDGYKIKPLTSNCSLIGIIELDDIVPAEQKLFKGDVILMASDGVSEVMNEDGVELGNTDLYLDTIKNSACKSASHFVDDIADLVLSYNGDKKLRDDVTMLVAKVGE